MKFYAVCFHGEKKIKEKKLEIDLSCLMFESKIDDSVENVLMLTVLTPQECLWKCIETDGCKGYSWASNHEISCRYCCFLKKENSPRIHATNWISGPSICTSESQSHSVTPNKENKIENVKIKNKIEEEKIKKENKILEIKQDDGQNSEIDSTINKQREEKEKKDEEEKNNKEEEKRRKKEEEEKKKKEEERKKNEEEKEKKKKEEEEKKKKKEEDERKKKEEEEKKKKEEEKKKKEEEELEEDTNPNLKANIKGGDDKFTWDLPADGDAQSGNNEDTNKSTEQPSEF